MFNNGKKTKRAEYAEQILARLKKIDSLNEDEQYDLCLEIQSKTDILRKYIDARLMKPLVRKWINMDTFNEGKVTVLEALFKCDGCWTNAMTDVLLDSFDQKAPLTETRYEGAKLFHKNASDYGDYFEESEPYQMLENYMVRYLTSKAWKEVKADFDFAGKPCYWKPNLYKYETVYKVYKQNGPRGRFNFDQTIKLKLNLFEDEVIWVSDKEGLARIPLDKIVLMELDQVVSGGEQYNLLHLYLENNAGSYLTGSRWVLLELKEAITYFRRRKAAPVASHDRVTEQQPAAVAEPQPQSQPAAVESQPNDVELQPALSKDEGSTERSPETFEPDLRTALYPLYERLQQIDAEQAYSTFCVQWGSRYRKGGVLFVGRAVNGWITDDRDTATLFRPGDQSQIFARDDQMRWVERENICARSAFWRVVGGLSRHLTGDSTDWYERIAYSNLYKLAPSSGENPSNSLCGRQYEVCAEILRREIEVLAPSAVVLLCGIGWYYDFLCDLNGEADPECIDQRTWSGGAINVYRIGNTVYIGGDHPQGKDERAYIETLTAFFPK